MREAARQHDRIERTQRRGGVPNELGLPTKAFNGLHDIVLAVRPGENDHTHSRCHCTTVPTAVPCTVADPSPVTRPGAGRRPRPRPAQEPPPAAPALAGA